MPTNIYLHNIDLDQNQLINPVLHNASSAPTSPIDGQLYYNTTTKKVYYYNSTTTTWTEVGAVYNIYNLDGTLTGDRTVTMLNYNLTFAGNTSATQFIVGSRARINGGLFLYDYLSFNGTTSANKMIFANELTFTTNNSLAYSDAARFTITTQSPSSNSGTGTVALLKLLMPVDTGTQAGNSKALVIDFNVTTNAGVLTALETVRGNNLLNSTSGSTYIGYSAAQAGSHKLDVSGTIRGTELYASTVKMSVGDTTYNYSGTYAGASGVFQIVDAGSYNTQIILRPTTSSIAPYHSAYWSYIQQGATELFITAGSYQTFSMGVGSVKKIKLYNADTIYSQYSYIAHVVDSNNFAVGTVTTVGTLGLVPSNTGGSMVAGTYYYRVVFTDWLGQNATQSSTEYSVTFSAGVTTGSVAGTVNFGNTNGAGVFGFWIYRRYVAPGDPNPSTTYTARYGASSVNTTFTDTGVISGSWGSGSYDPNAISVNLGSAAGIRNDGYIYGKSINTGQVTFNDQIQIGSTNDGVTYGLQYNTPGAYKSLGFRGDLRFGSSGTVSSIYYFGARYASNNSTYQITNFMTLGTPGDKIGVTVSNANNAITRIVNIIPEYNYTASTGHTITGIYYSPTLTSQIGVTTHYALHAVTGDVYIQGGSVGIGGTPNASYKLNISGGGIYVGGGITTTGAISAGGAISGSNFSGVGSQTIIGTGTGNWTFTNGGGGGWYFEWIQNGLPQMTFDTSNSLLLGLTNGNGNAKSILTMSSTTKGFLPPRMTGTQAEAIAPGTSEAGLILYVTSNGSVITTAPGWFGWNGTAWKKLDN